MAQCTRDVPWHRVVNAKGEVSPRADGAPSSRQVRLLRQDGVRIDRAGRIRDFAGARWTPAPHPHQP
jgi:methylated-DNA-protein-cysteine methyltransferase-like protein